MGQSFDSFRCVVMATRRFFVERNNMHFTHNSDSAPKMCKLWPPLGQLGHNCKEKVLTSISNQESAGIPCKCHTREGVGSVKVGEPQVQVREQNMQTAGGGNQSQPWGKCAWRQLKGSSRGKKNKTDGDLTHRRTGKAAPAWPGDAWGMCN